MLTGSGDRAFCSGADLSGTDAHEHFDVSALDRANRLVRAVTMLDRPVVVAPQVVAEPEAPTSAQSKGNVIDLMDALKSSLEESGKRSSAKSSRSSKARSRKKAS